jgi:Tat protein secretion system quality control protein TatD with DNase activity
MMELVDTHCHIQDASLELSGDDSMRALWLRAKRPNPDDMIAYAAGHGVTRLICVGTTVADSRAAVEFVKDRPGTWASVGLHPHEAKAGEAALKELRLILGTAGPAAEGSSRRAQAALWELRATGYFPSASPLAGMSSKAAAAEPGVTPLPRAVPEGMFEHGKVGGDQRRGIGGGKFGTSQDGGFSRADKIVAIGECGLDYFYNHSSKPEQERALRSQIELALEHNLPLIFHIRDAFADFWPIFDSYQGLRGVLHSFTDTPENLGKALERGLYIGINGIMTFTKQNWQLEVAKSVPSERLVLETDAPFLTPVPLRGTINEPAHVELIAKFLSELRQQPFEELATITPNNALQLFSI